jgi:type III pantothenate kinase
LYLTADIGNTRIKYALWTREGTIVETGIPQTLEALYHRLGGLDGFAWCSTIGALPELFSGYSGPSFELTSAAKLPFSNEYKTPGTLGRDRIAAAAGAQKLYPGKDVLILDCGTCITSDLITADGIYKGGSISPGLQMRYKALNQFTEKLPVISHRENIDFIGKTTEESILSGVWNGMVGELNMRIEKTADLYPNLIVIATGGDAPLLADRLKYRIFAEPLLIHHGLLNCFFLNEF